MVLRKRIGQGFVLLCLALAGLPGCGTEDPAPRETPSQTKELGGPWMFLWSCKMMKYDFDKFGPIFKNQLSDFKNSCTVPDLLAYDATIESGRIPTLSDYSGEDFSGECRNNFYYLETIEKHLREIRDYWRRKGCDDRVAERERTRILDYPACLDGCMNGERDCYTCQAGFKESKGAEVSDRKGRITCQSKLDAVRAVQEWCSFVGTDERCEPRDIECSVAGEAELLPSMSGTFHIETLEHSLRTSVETYAKAKGKIPGVAEAESRVGLKVGGDLDFTITMKGMNQNPWVERYGRKEGNSNAIYTCSLTSSAFTAVTANGKVEVGLQFMGNGAAGGVEVRADGRVTRSNIGETLWLSASGLTKKQIKGRCNVWAKNYLTTQIQNTGVVRAIEEFQDDVAGQKYELSADGVSCVYENKPDDPYDLTRMWITFGENHTTVEYELYYKYWWDLNSPKYQIRNAKIAPYKNAITGRSMSDERLAQFLSEVVEPYSSGKWNIKSCRS